ncbi:uncharacterized protein KRP23_2809 [Phytophthora ramorum]|uniref:uncharacterized protein n=1 Tax=Phytophthora ramorum TaxID=164328 RepID=UPI0030A2E87E|nr:hypothetical protein KRP23_2809 [Phytophthora ramorum]
MTANETEVPQESASTRSHSDEGANIPQESCNPAAEDASSSSPTFAFAAWKAGLELMLRQESDSLHESVQALQGDFDDRSQFVRGDFAWRKQIAAFHDRLQDILTSQLGAMVANVSKHATQVAESLAQTLAKTERDGQRAVQQQEQKGETALRRARTALAKEVERITRLERCLRLEEARQAAATLAERERQLIAEHHARESHLQALLGDMRSSNESLDTLNSQLLEALRTSRTELAQLRNTLVRSVSRPKQRSSSLAQGESKNAGSDTARRGGGVKTGKNSIVSGLESLPSTANELLLVPTLQQSLSAATQSVANLKNRVSELESARDCDKLRLRELQLSLAQAESEKAKATKLLGEARSALIDNETKLAQAAGECARLQDKLDTLQALAEGREQTLVDSQRLEDATRDRLAVLTSRVQHIRTIEARQREFEHVVGKWKEARYRKQDKEEYASVSDDGGRSLERIVECFLRQDTSDGSQIVDFVEAPKELEVRLRYEFERRFGEQLNLRVGHERRRVLERLERICAAEAKERHERAQRTRQSVAHVNNLESDFTRLKRLVKAAYNQLGICVGAWSETDLDSLRGQLDALQSQVQALEQKLEAADNRAESQRVLLVRAELSQQEKDLLLAELTSRYRHLQATQHAWGTQQQQNEQQEQAHSMERKPLTVYGIPQPLTQKPRLHALMQLPTRSRPASAAPCLGSVEHQPLRQNSQPPPSRLGSYLVGKDKLEWQNKRDGRVEEVEEHVRSVLKSALMRSELDDTVGSDGVLEILHRRRHRK